MKAYVLNPNSIGDLTADVIGHDGHPRIMPASFYANTTREERSLLAVRHGLYLLPTLELVSRLRELIGGRTAIEIGSGNGVLAKELGIPATDSRMQEEPAIAAHYAQQRQPTVRYGDNVERLNAYQAVAKYQPQVVLASWVTHRYDASRPELAGNMYGVEEELLLYHCQEYIFIGNQEVHQAKPVWIQEHALELPNWLYSRALNGSPDFICRWNGLVD